MITAYGMPLAQVTSFKYLMRFILAEEKKWPAGVIKLRKSRQKWVWLIRLLIREDADVRNLGQI